MNMAGAQYVTSPPSFLAWLLYIVVLWLYECCISNYVYIVYTYTGIDNIQGVNNILIFYVHSKYQSFGLTMKNISKWFAKGEEKSNRLSTEHEL